MKKTYLLGALFLLPASMTWAEPEFYGRANVSAELVDEDDDWDTALLSNASRLGVKGSELINDSFEVIYQLEYEVSFDDGDDDGDTLSQRNIFVGIRDHWGQVIAGHVDTPFKKAQGEVDLFNDLRGDLGKTLSPYDNREANSVIYSTAEDAFGPFQANLAYIASEEEGRTDGKSASVTYEQDNLYAAMAVDQDVEAEGTEAVRLVSAYRWQGWQLGGLVEVADTADGGTEHGWLVSSAYKLDDRWVLKAQGGQSDLRNEGGATLSLGADYVFSESTKAFAFYTTVDADDQSADHYLGAGMEYRF